MSSEPPVITKMSRHLKSKKPSPTTKSLSSLTSLTFIPGTKLTTLPDEVLLKITGNLDYFTLTLLRATCHKFRSLPTKEQIGDLLMHFYNTILKTSPSFISQDLFPCINCQVLRPKTLKRGAGKDNTSPGLCVSCELSVDSILFRKSEKEMPTTCYSCSDSTKSHCLPDKKQIWRRECDKCYQTWQSRRMGHPQLWQLAVVKEGLRPEDFQGFGQAFPDSAEKEEREEDDDKADDLWEL